MKLLDGRFLRLQLLKRQILMEFLRFLLLSVLALPTLVSAQQSITLDECFDLATSNYPLALKTILLEDQYQLDSKSIQKDKLPKIDLNAQATYQSDVTQVPLTIPNVTIDSPNKDQYRATMDVNQILYHGGLIDATARVSEADYKVRQQEVDVSLYALKGQISQLYLSLLLLQENEALLEAKEQQLQSRLVEVEAGVKFGTLLPSSADALEVELLRIRQEYTGLHHSRIGLLQRLSILIGRTLPSEVVLERPEVLINPQSGNNRPELMLFDLRKERIDRSSELLTRSKLPAVNAFAQGGYGNPGLNMLDNSFNTFFMTGLRFKWNVFDWNMTREEKKSLQISRSIVDTEKETLDLKTRLALTDIMMQINTLEETIGVDLDIIALREKILKTSDSQLQNGVITTSDYVSDFTKLYEAKNQHKLHQTQLLQKQIEYKLTKGTYGTSDIR